MKKLFFFLIFSSIIFSSLFFFYPKDVKKFNFATCVDTEYYSRVLDLIGSIHQHHLLDLGEIAIFDLGLQLEERKELDRIAFVKVYDLEKVNEKQFEKCSINPNGKVVRGWFSFKAVVMKQALDLFPELFFLDADLRLKRPITPLYKQVRKKGYFFVDSGHKIWEVTPQSLVKKLSLDHPDKKKILNQFAISSGIQGLSRDLYPSYIYPIYEYAKDLSYFIDDGSGLLGYGASRHDQTLYSIQARLLGLKVRGAIHGKMKKRGNKISIDQYIYFSEQVPKNMSFKKYIIYKK